jgi:hypothetical protein
MLIASACMAASPKLPATAPIPTESPLDQPETGTANPQSAPIPTSRPDLPPSAEVAPTAAERSPARQQTFGPPAPPKPAAPKAEGEDADDPEAESATEDERLCRDDLGKLGVEFAEHEPLADPAAGCFVANPVTLKSLGKTIKLAPEAILNCDMARATARFMQDVASPAAKTWLGSDLTSINHASAYVCRPRNGTLKLSEHAFGNAIDVSSFGLADGRRIEVKAGVEAKVGAFLDTIRKAACGPFKTVLGPGSDPDHALHFHFDLAKRRSGSTFCQ